MHLCMHRHIIYASIITNIHIQIYRYINITRSQIIPKEFECFLQCFAEVCCTATNHPAMPRPPTPKHRVLGNGVGGRGLGQFEQE